MKRWCYEKITIIFNILLYEGLLTGCLYPKEIWSNAVPYEDQLQVVQKAVVTFKEQNDGDIAN